MSDSALTFDNVVKKFGGRTALDEFNLEVPKGVVFGLVGSNGAGKTTSMAVATSLLRANSGSVNVLGLGQYDPLLHSGRVSLMPQDSNFPRYARVRDLLMYYATLQGQSAKHAQDNIAQVIDLVHLSDRVDSQIRTLSHGMRRRVVIAQAFLGNPELVLLDEPMSGLDPKEVMNIRRLLHKRQEGQTIVVSSHNLFELERVCTHVAFIEDGKLVKQDTMSTITGQHHVLNYLIEAGANASLPGLRELMPDTSFTIPGDGSVLTCSYAEAGHTTAEVNSIVLNHLLGRGVRILEVRRGAELETAYMQQT